MKFTWLYLLLVLAGPRSVLAEDAPRVARPRLLLNLTDGSRLIGTTELLAVPLRSEAVGELQVPLEKIVALKFHTEPPRATVMLGNGDKIDGTVKLPTMTVTTVFGVVRIPLELIRDLQVGVESAGFAIQMSAALQNYIEIPASDQFDVTATWTLEFWARMTGGKGEILSLVMRGGEDCGPAGAIQMDSFRGKIRFWAVDGHGEQDSGGATAAVDICDGEWHHWAGVVGDGQIRLYLDGVRVASHPFVAGATGSTCPLRIGYRATHGGCYIDGAMTEIRISRVARYKTDFIPAIAHAVDDDTIAYWRFKEGQGIDARDETGKHPGKLRGQTPPAWVEGVTRRKR